jgi:preprotein translocase subunit SecA
MDQLKDAIRFHGYAQKDPLMVYKSEGYKLFEGCLEKIATLTALRILNIRITLPNGMTVSPDQLQLKSQEQIDAERKAAEEAKAATETRDERGETREEAQETEQLSAEGAKAAGLAGQAATSETNALSEEQRAPQPMPQSALPGTRPAAVRRTYTNPNVVAAARRAQQAGPKLGRNDPCWCGSGLKYKKCHGKDVE